MMKSFQPLVSISKKKKVFTCEDVPSLVKSGDNVMLAWKKS